MNPGDLLLHLNPLLLLASLAAGALHLRDGDAEKQLLQRVSLGLLLGSLTASLLLLGSYFYRTDKNPLSSLNRTEKNRIIRPSTSGSSPRTST